MRTVKILVFSLIASTSIAQDVQQKLAVEMSKMQSDSQFRHAIISLYVTDEAGAIVFASNEKTGLAPASCQKIITSVSAYELLGKDFRYKTSIWYEGIVEKGLLNGTLHIKGSGDPSIGSWRILRLSRMNFSVQ
jgi:D-alanyl-D-alanine carboxypeptidase/D-alanyl-D-alanine-endopeptidase (penicillin-binding protein 4)